MKIALVSEYFYPKSKGGTEKYVYELAEKLISEKNQVEIITVSSDDIKHYNFKGITVRVIAPENNEDKNIISGLKPAHNLSAFNAILKEEKYDLIHFHSLTPAFSLHHIHIAKAFAIPVYFTAHIPSITCIHGDLMQYGKTACDGKIIERRCMSCYISKKQIPKGLSILLASLISQLNYPKSIANVVYQKQQDLSRLNFLCDQIFIFTTWQKRIFIENGIDESKLTLTQQMTLPEPDTNNHRPLISKNNRKIKLAFIGRICHEKGLHILLDAIKVLKKENIELHIAAIIENKKDPYFLKMKDLTKNNANIFWSYNLDDSEVQQFYEGIDLICVPSIGYETGPYVLYEAFKLRIPVLANNLGDMEAWEQKGFPIELYNNTNELVSLLKSKLFNDISKRQRASI